MKILISRLLDKQPIFSDVKEVVNAYKLVETKRTFPVLVLDDDPTGIQTVHDIPVYMFWDERVMRKIFENNQLAFIHINTRAYKPDKVKFILKQVMDNACKIAKQTGKDFEIISRSDSTLRGHFPLETEFLKTHYENFFNKKVDGEIMIPFFKEGGRITVDDVHYVVDNEYAVPANETEFAQDPDFSFKYANLRDYIEEKTDGAFRRQDVLSIPLKVIRENDHEELCRILRAATNFQKVIVNAIDYNDLMVFIPALYKVMEEGKKFIFRTAASFVKSFGFVTDKEYLNRRSLKIDLVANPKILLIAGSFTGKTSLQLKTLFNNHPVKQIILDVEVILESTVARKKLINDAVSKIEDSLCKNENSVVYTSRTFVNKGNHLVNAEVISNTLIEIVQHIQIRPDIVIAKGGITSSIIAVQALQIREANIEGQVLPGVPLIIADNQSKWPGIPYIIFPGNVGSENSISELYYNLKG